MDRRRISRGCHVLVEKGGKPAFVLAGADAEATIALYKQLTATKSSEVDTDRLQYGLEP